MKIVYSGISKNDLAMYACHSIRVWVCVFLDKAGIPPDFIKKQLCWLGESYRVYLRGTNKINKLHNVGLKLNESPKTAVELIRVINSTGSDQLLDEDIPEMGEHYQGNYPIGSLENIFLFLLSTISICNWLACTG